MGQNKGFEKKLREAHPTLDDIKPNFDSIKVNFKKIKLDTTLKTESSNSVGNSTNVEETSKEESKLLIKLSKKTGLPLMIKVENTSSKVISSKLALIKDKNKSCYHFLKSIKKQTQIENPEKDLKVSSTIIDENGISHIRMNHMYKGYKIFGSELIVHIDKNGNAKGMNGNYQIIKNDIDVSPIIRVEKAIDTVRKDLEKKFVTFSLTNEQKTFLKIQEIEIDTVLYETNLLLNTHVLAYKISIRPNIQSWYDYFINAKNGKILNSYIKTCHVDGPKTVSGLDLNNVNRTINALEKSSVLNLTDISQQMYNSATENGMIITVDSKNTFGNNLSVSEITFLGSFLNNPTAVSAHKNAEIAYNYFKNTHNRNSINGNGGDIL